MKKKQEPILKKQDEMLSLDQLVPSAGGSVFLLARLAMLRALEIDSGSRPLVDHLPLDKATTIALKEIANGKIVLKGSELNLAPEKETMIEETEPILQ